MYHKEKCGNLACMRLFIGLPITGDLLHSAQAIKAEYQPHPATQGIHWSPESNWHLTLRFLGESDAVQVDALVNALRPLATQHAPFEFTSNGLLILPPRKPRVFCVSVRLNNPLALLYRDLHKASEACGFTPEKRPFLPHITLGRWKKPELIDFHPHKPSLASCVADRIHLYESRPGELNSEYHPIETFHLTTMHGAS